MAKKRNKLSREEEEEVVLQMTNNKSQELNLNTVRINFKCKTENQKKFINLIKEKVIVIGAGYAGVGKTMCAVAEALRLLKNEPQYRKIILVKSVTVLKGEELGFLKGSIDDKMSPYTVALKHVCTKLIGPALTNQLLEQKTIEVQPLAFQRGITLDNTILIVDESQNISYDNMKTILTRIGENSKIIIIGDTKQIDLKNKKESCLTWLIEKFQSNDKFGTITFSKEDQVRNPVISIIEDMFDEREVK